VSAAAPAVLFIEKPGADTGPVRERLQERGVRVLRAESGPEAVAVARRQGPDLIVADGHVESALSALVAGGSPAPVLILAPDVPALREAMRRRLGPLYFHSRLVDPARLLETVLAELAAVRGEPAPPPRPPRLVLCVDDDPTFLSSLSRVLARGGYSVVTRQSGPEALELLARVRPELAIVDLMMPGMDGLDFLDALRRREGPSVPVVLLSALGADEARYEGHRRGASLYLTKPCEPDRVLDAVEYLVGDLDENSRRILRSRI